METLGESVLTCSECGYHEIISQGVDYNNSFYCKKCAEKEDLRGDVSTLQGGLMMDKCRHGNEKYKCNLCVIRGEVETIHGWREIAKESPTRTGIYIAYKYPDDYNGEMYSCELWSEKHGGWCEAETEFDLWLELPDPPMSTIQGG